MARSEKWSDGIQNRVMGDTQERGVSHIQILCIKIFYCKTCKMEESMMGQFSDGLYICGIPGKWLSME
jgi:hypothetical protein